MGMYYSTYFFYGVHVPREKYRTSDLLSETDWLELVIRTEFPGSGLSCIVAGDYDRDELFLYVVFQGQDVEVKPGSFGKVPVGPVQKYADRLKKFETAAGYEHLDEPGFLVVPDLG